MSGQVNKRSSITQEIETPKKVQQQEKRTLRLREKPSIEGISKSSNSKVSITPSSSSIPLVPTREKKAHPVTEKDSTRKVLNKLTKVQLELPKKRTLRAKPTVLLTSQSDSTFSKTSSPGTPDIISDYVYQGLACRFCRKTFTTAGNARIHEKTVHPKLFELFSALCCDRCGVKFKSPNDLKAHKQKCKSKGLESTG